MSRIPEQEPLFLSEETARMFEEAKALRPSQAGVKQNEATTVHDEDLAHRVDSTDEDRESESIEVHPDKEREIPTVIDGHTNDDGIVSSYTRVTKKQSKKNRVFAVLICLIGLLATIYIIRSYHYRSHFFSKTTINGIDVSEMTSEEAKDVIQKNVESYKLVIEERGGNKEELTGKDIDLLYQDDSYIDIKIAGQIAWKWPFYIKESFTYTTDFSSEYKEDTAKEKILNLDCMQKENQTAPENAVMKKSDDGEYEVIPEKEGTTLDTDKTTRAIIDALDKRAKNVSLEESGCYIEPEVRSEDENLNMEVSYLNDYLAINMKYLFGNQEEVINGEDLEQYIKNKDGNVTVETDWIDELVESWAKKYNTYGNSFSFQTHSGKTVEIEQGGDYGWYLDQEKTAKELKEHIKNADSGGYQPAWRHTAHGWGAECLGKNYIEISLSEQKLWIYQDGKEILECDIVSGKPVPGSTTVEGCFSVDNENATDKPGILDTQGHGDVSYWIPFNGGQGIHDASWRAKFGEDIYKTNGTHGSINVSVDDAKLIRETIKEGDAVVVY